MLRLSEQGGYGGCGGIEVNRLVMVHTRLVFCGVSRYDWLLRDY